MKVKVTLVTANIGSEQAINVVSVKENPKGVIFSKNPPSSRWQWAHAVDVGIQQRKKMGQEGRDANIFPIQGFDVSFPKVRFAEAAHHACSRRWKEQ